ncbi:hypothetical protein CC78DRAFT_576011 [Lojkania enalia]|uniref:Uncharacterized protein n=1 Tax=Lojkania enalia TaxID=147567 RepID=A0A9P4N760_9PLEO|nr:hypothetical protein CC78DRAFT_576011 [Didymosphaeria enalia]
MATILAHAELPSTYQYKYDHKVSSRERRSVRELAAVHQRRRYPALPSLKQHLMLVSTVAEIRKMGFSFWALGEAPFDNNSLEDMAYVIKRTDISSRYGGVEKRRVTSPTAAACWDKTSDDNFATEMRVVPERAAESLQRGGRDQRAKFGTKGSRVAGAWLAVVYSRFHSGCVLGHFRYTATHVLDMGKLDLDTTSNDGLQRGCGLFVDPRWNADLVCRL